MCNDCSHNERRVQLYFSDPTRPGINQGLSADIVLRRLPTRGMPLQLTLRQRGSFIPDEGTNPPPEQYRFNVPWGEYVLTKVE